MSAQYDLDNSQVVFSLLTALFKLAYGVYQKVFCRIPSAKTNFRAGEIYLVWIFLWTEPQTELFPPSRPLIDLSYTLTH